MPKASSRLLALLLSGCAVVALGAFSQPAAAQQEPAASAPAAPNPAQLEQLLAPIALYPDALVAQILMASTYPLEIVEAARWSKANPKVQGTALEDAMQKQSWDPSVKSLTAFPQVLAMMNEKLSWTQQLGDAFLADQKSVMDAVQKLRRAANQQGNLKSSKEQTVTVQSSGAEQTIIIEPADPTVVYVPTYNPTVVYGAWPYPAYPPAAYYPPGYVAGAAFFSFTAGVAVGYALWGDCDWHGHDVNINQNIYNNFNRTNISGNTRISGNNNLSGKTQWNHNPDHRRGVSYKDQNVARRFNRGANSRDVQAREQFRGRAEAGRADLGQRGFDRGGQGGAFNRGQAGNRGSGGLDRAGQHAGNLGAGGGGVQRTGHEAGGFRDFSGGRQASGFGGADSGQLANHFGSRGAASRQGMAGGGGRSFGGGGFGGGRHR